MSHVEAVWLVQTLDSAAGSTKILSEMNQSNRQIL